MFFQFSSEITGLAGSIGKGEGLEFQFNSPNIIVVRLGKTYPDGLKPSKSSDAVCTSTTQTDPPDKIAAELEAGWMVPVVEGKINEKDPVLVFVDGVFAELRTLMVATVTLFRWRQGLAEGPPDPCHTLKERYSEDGVVWREITVIRGIAIRWGLAEPSEPKSQIREQVVELATSGIEEPLGRQLFREAWSQKDSRPRSALVVGVAAAEVGFKKLVGSLIPQAQWLVDEVQTPALSKMLSKFLPTLPIKAKLDGKSIRPPRNLLRQLDKAVERRNKLVHAGEPPPRWDELEEMLRAVNDFLWICDLYQGHGWAAQHISAATQTTWDREADSNKGI